MVHIKYILYNIVSVEMQVTSWCVIMFADIQLFISFNLPPFKIFIIFF